MTVINEFKQNLTANRSLVRHGSPGLYGRILSSFTFSTREREKNPESAASKL